MLCLRLLLYSFPVDRSVAAVFSPMSLLDTLSGIQGLVRADGDC